MERSIKIVLAAWALLIAICMLAKWLNPPATPESITEQQVRHTAIIIGASWPLLWLIVAFTGGQILEMLSLDAAKRKADRNHRLLMARLRAETRAIE